MKIPLILLAFSVALIANAHAEQSFQETDAALNTAYASIQSRLKSTPETAQQFTQAQRAWIRFRDAECAFQAAQSAGGRIYPQLIAQCRQTLTRQRIYDFQRYLACTEGDLICPVPAKP